MNLGDAVLGDTRSDAAAARADTKDLFGALVRQTELFPTVEGRFGGSRRIEVDDFVVRRLELLPSVLFELPARSIFLVRIGVVELCDALFGEVLCIVSDRIVARLSGGGELRIEALVEGRVALRDLE